MFSCFKRLTPLLLLISNLPAAKAECEIAQLLFTENRTSFESLKVRTELLIKRAPLVTDSKFLSEIDELLAQDNLIFSTAHKEGLREDILHNPEFSFKNKFQMKGKSNATASAQARAEVESYRLGISLKDYAAVAQEQLPLYGYLQFKKGMAQNQTGYLKVNYGEDIWTLKPEKVINTASFSLGDSMTYKGYNSVFRESSFNQKPEIHIPMNVTNDPHTYFLPFKTNKRILKQHYLNETLERSNNHKQLHKRRNVAKPFYNFVDPYNSTPNPDELLNYIEIQYFKKDKPIGIKDIEGLTFTKKPPSKELYDYLMSRDIEIKDWRIQSEEPIHYIPHDEGGLSEKAMQELMIAKKYIQRLRDFHYLRVESHELENIIVRSTKFKHKEQRQEFLKDSGLDEYTIKKLLKADVPQDINPLTQMNWRY
ncbi:MAG: hypothetical protein KC478_10840 [Bacteriovoracaceae bacterium]|nr:hypothetical protein [Bacteriovoracaceae bacterium]